MKPVIVITVYRRYYELSRAIQRIRELSHEFDEKPDVVIVWARPEVPRLWYFKKLLDEGIVTKLLTRLALPGEDETSSTTYPESNNIRVGLEWVKANYDAEKTYAIVQAADIFPKDETAYAYVNQHMKEGAGAVVLFWENGCVRSQIWHTNFFAVRLKPEYWPPVSTPDQQDTLERQWGRQLAATQPPNVIENHNSRQKRFLHDHLSETQGDWPRLPQNDGSTLSLLISGYIPWWKRLLISLRLCKPFKRSD